MAERAQLIAELASNHGGDMGLAAELVRAAAASGADWVKVQLYDVADLSPADPQYAWLAQSQLRREQLEALIVCAASHQVQFTASVFGVSSAALAHEAGLRTIKIGSGDSARSDLRTYCLKHFETVWLSHGLGGEAEWSMRVVNFYGVSQYPAPAPRNYAALLQCYRVGPWGWSDHGRDIDASVIAMNYGCSHVERHFALPHAGRRQEWDTIPEHFAALRRHAEAVAWEGTPECQAARDKFLTRWTYGQTADAR